MRIIPPENSLECDPEIRENLQQYIDHPAPAAFAPCPGCVKHIPSECSADCSEAPRALSIEPDRYPIEPKVVPLVYQIMATGVMTSCWSCEGHMNADNELWKVPQVCFYSASSIYPKLVSMHLNNLYQAKQLSYPWHIVLSGFSESLVVTYGLQPNLNQVTDVRLGSLQRDLVVIAEDMSTKTKAIAQHLLDKYCS